MHRSRSKSKEKATNNSRIRYSRAKTNQSQHMESMNTSIVNRTLVGQNVFDRLYQHSRKKQSSRTEKELSKRSDSRVSINSQNRSMN